MGVHQTDHYGREWANLIFERLRKRDHLSVWLLLQKKVDKRKENN
jgi:hypothetical protein